MKAKLFECLKNSNQRVDTNKILAFIGAIVGEIILIILAFKNYDGIEWLFSAYLVATLGQLPSKGLNELGRLKVEARKPSHSNASPDVNNINITGTLGKPKGPDLT